MKAPHKHESNVEALSRIMEYSRQGALMQAFVIDALEKRSEFILANEADVRSAMDGSIISPEAWINCAKELKRELTLHLGGVVS